ncbi:hypothetical protein C0J52_17745, partial [Blattella germanica]
INSNGASSREIDVLARSPTGRELACPVQETDGVYTATFQPDEAGECFTVDASGTGGLGDVCLDIVSSGRSVPHRMESLGGSLYRVSFVPQQSGKHRVYVYFNGSDVKGSPFPLRVGSHRSRDKSNSPTSRRVSNHQHEDGRESSRSPQITTSAPYVKVTPPTPSVHSTNENYFREENRSSLEQRLSRTHIVEDRISSPSRLTNGRGPSPIISNNSPSPVNSPYRDSPVHNSPFSPIYKPNASPTFKVTSPSPSPTGFKSSSSPLLNSSNVYKSSPSPAHSPLVFKHSPSPVGSPTFHHNGGSHFESSSSSRHFESNRVRRGSVDMLDDGKGGAVDTTSNVRGE